ncbi:MAG: hypothetical protein JWM44_3371 [Bacilli bacterium]|jgi:hypothetical protein|nr:hypothetical protein [Bacilli bacterium]
MFKSPIGFAVAAIAIILTLSPEARKSVRKFAVKGTETLLDLTDQIKDATEGIRNLTRVGNEDTIEQQGFIHPASGIIETVEHH